ncbi:MAG: hypothetical protein M3M95_02355, partial [Pseudomonadota bacterium]|nr:hypothetical protein [Pseudomonadota bacterium]
MRCAPLLAASLSLAACVGPQAGPEAEPTAVSAPAQEAAAPGPEENLPIRGEGPAPPAADQLLSRVAIGSGAEETEPLPIFAAVAAARPELFL